MRSTLACLVLMIAAGVPAFAQSTSGPAPGTGTGTGSSASGGSGAMPTDLDLPFQKPVYVAPQTPPQPTPPVNPTPDPGDTDDPRDEPPPVIYGEEIDSETDTIFYVIDISGSMDWDNQSFTDIDGNRRSGTRMERAKTELIRSIMGLSRNFKFNMIAFDCGTRRWSPQMKQADDGNKAAGIAWVRSLQPTGATGTGPAVAMALSTDRDNKSVVLLTDGEPNCGVPEYDDDWYYNESNVMNGHRRMIRNANTQHATINVFGIAASGDYRRFCVNVASDAGGSYFDVP
jgi:hypothetical protein